MTAQERAALFSLASGFMVTKAIVAAVRLGLPELVNERPRSAAELAAAAGADPDAVRRLLRALASLGVFARDGGVVTHTSLSRLLCRGVPGSFAGQALLLGELQYPTWGESLETFRTGEPAFPRTHQGLPLFAWLDGHPDLSALFTEAMAGGAAFRRQVLLDQDWSGVSTVVDVGGGNGTTLVGLLLEQPGLSGTVVDRPDVEADAIRTIEAAGLAQRCRFAAGSFFDAVPAGADVYVMSAILHDWDDASCDAILRVVRAAMAPTSRLLLVDSVVSDGDEPDNAKLMDLHMMVVLGGRERSENEWRSLLSRNGFTTLRVEPGLVEAGPADRDT